MKRRPAWIAYAFLVIAVLSLGLRFVVEVLR